MFNSLGVWGQWSYFALKMVGGLVVFVLGMLSVISFLFLLI